MEGIKILSKLDIVKLRKNIIFKIRRWSLGKLTVFSFHKNVNNFKGGFLLCIGEKGVI